MKIIKTLLRYRCIVCLLIPALLFAELQASAQTNSISPNQSVQPNRVASPEVSLVGTAALIIVTGTVAYYLYYHIKKALKRPPPPPGKYNIIATGCTALPACNGEYYYYSASGQAFGSYYRNDNGFTIWGAPISAPGTNSCVWVITAGGPYGGSYIVKISITWDSFYDTNFVPVGGGYNYFQWGSYPGCPLHAPYNNLTYWAGVTNYPPPNNTMEGPDLNWDYNNPVDNSAIMSLPATAIKSKIIGAATGNTDPNYYAAWFIISPSDINDPADFTSASATFNVSSGTVIPTPGQPINTNANYALDPNWVATVSNLWGCVPNLTHSSFGFNGNQVSALPYVNIQFTNGVLSITRSNFVVTSCAINSGGYNYLNGDLLYVLGGVYTRQATLKVGQVLNAGTATNMIIQLFVSDGGSYTVPPPTTPFYAPGGEGGMALVSVSSAPVSPLPIRAVPVSVKRGNNLTQLTTLFQMQGDTNTPLTTFEDDNAPSNRSFYMVK